MAHLVGNVQSVVVGGQSNVSLLLTVRSDRGSGLAHRTTISVSTIHSPDQSPDLGGLNIVQLLDSVLDLPLVALQVNDEYQGVVVLDLLHGALSVQRVLNDTELVHSGQVRDGLSSILGVSSKLEGVGSVEGGGVSDLSERGGLGSLQGGLLGQLGLGLLRLGGSCKNENSVSSGSENRAILLVYSIPDPLFLHWSLQFFSRALQDLVSLPA